MLTEKEQQELRSEYNPEGSDQRRMQLRMLETLKYIDRICRDNDIQYWLSSGTLLGAVRHGGFIPWDDDADIELLKADYDKLKHILLQCPDSRFALQYGGNDVEYLWPYYRIVDTESKVRQFSMQECNYKYDGLAVDVFYMAPSFSRNLEYLIYGIHAVFVGRLGRIKNNSIRRFLIRLGKGLIHGILIPCICFLNRISGSKMLRPNVGSGYLCRFDKNIFFPLKRMKFEDYEFPVPNDWDAYLKQMYGNYWELPQKQIRNGCPKQVISL